MVEIDIIFGCRLLKGYRQYHLLLKDYFLIIIPETQSVIFTITWCALKTLAVDGTDMFFLMINNFFVVNAFKIKLVTSAYTSYTYDVGAIRLFATFFK
jgi:hypothetical protein